MVKNLSEYTDRSEPIEPDAIDPRARAERLGVPLIGGGQVRTEHEAAPPPPVKVVGVCSLCGMVITSGVNASCDNEGCPTGLARVTHALAEYYNQG